MARITKIGNNEACPCGSTTKYKRCCKNKVNWENLAYAPPQEYARHLTIRGKNLMFLSTIMGAIQVDTLNHKTPFSKIKNAFTPKAVQEIHLAISDLWPDIHDYEICLEKEKTDVTALYTGTYEPTAIFKALTRHSLYSEKIYLVDPFLDPRRVRDEFNPMVHPAEHRANTIKFAFLWLTLAPWIQAGIVNFIRPLHDFVPGLQNEILNIQRERSEAIPELAQFRKKEVEKIVDKFGPTDRGFAEWHFLSNPDIYFSDFYRSFSSDNPFHSENEFLEYIRFRRDQHPYYVDKVPGQHSEFLHETTGANYELAKRMCALTNSHIVTDLAYRWKELKLDRPKDSENDEQWSPFAKALHDSPLKILEGASLEAALKLRSENRLERMRLFFSKVWKSCREPNQFSKANATNLAAELSEKIAEAETEWKKIDQDLLRWLGIAGGAAMVGAYTGFAPALPVAGVGGVAALIEGQFKRKNFKDRYPAGFFLGLKEK